MILDRQRRDPFPCSPRNDLQGIKRRERVFRRLFVPRVENHGPRLPTFEFYRSLFSFIEKRFYVERIPEIFALDDRFLR